MNRTKILKWAFLSLFINSAYSIYNGILGFVAMSWWHITVCAYHIILSVMRFSVLLFERKNKKNCIEIEYFIMRFSGVMFLFLLIILIGTVVLAVQNNESTKHHQIVMITIATYAFTKVTFAIINMIKARKIDSPVIKTLRNISFADASVSIFSLQLSMLVSFQGMSQAEISIFNILTGVAVCILVMILGINLIRRKGKNNGKIQISTNQQSNC